MPPISLSSSHNDDLSMSLAFRDFYTRTTEYDVLSKWFEINVAQLNNIKSMLCVGSGLGFDLTLARKIKSLTHLTMIDKSKAQLEASIHARSTEHFLVEVKYISIEKFIPTIRYDLVLFSHVLYYIPDRIKVLKKTMQMLSDHGFILIFHQTEKGINEIQKAFDSTKYSYCLNDLKQDLEAENIVYTSYIRDSTVRIDSPSKELCDFILEKNCSEDEYMRLVAHLRSLGTTMDHPSAIVIISLSLNKNI